MKRILIIAASPRENGNSDKLAIYFSKGAKESGNKATIIYLRHLNIHGCLGCEYCYEDKGRCCQKDDMQNIYRLLEQTDIIVFATPIYYQAFPSQLKAFIDRLYVTENRAFPINGSVLLATYATPGKAMSKFTVNYFKILSEYHHWNVLGIITKDSLDEKDDIVNDPVLLQAYNMGLDIGKE